MNELQQKEFDILKTFADICDELELTYFLVCGSALGAVKYGGFIPWDDDVDVALPRADYEKFLSYAPDKLPEYLFLQNYRTDPEFPKIFSKLRDSRTAYIETDYQKLDINHGVFIDIFALDGYPSKADETVEFEKRKKKYLRLTSCSLMPSASLRSRVLRRALRIFGFHKRTACYLEEYEAMIKKYENADVYCNYGNFRGEMEKTPKEIYGNGREAVFEGLRVRVPSRWDEYLTEKYGAWRADPPKDEQVGHHYYTVLDLNKSYETYVKKKCKP